ncbi:MAG TPA: ATP-binding protein, partial [Legionellaceae bacterium]|nr:ATP-binding protein [Legionellaceae bacterium]
ETFNLYQCIQDIIQLEKPTIIIKQLNLINNYDERIPKFIINDKTKIHRILLNLVGNAIKFTSKGTVTIETKLLDISNNTARIYFAVHDTGIGILPNQRDKVFERFYRASPSYKGIYKGHGVGLHIAQNYSKLLQSEIKLVSEENKGTTFYFELSSTIGKENEATPNTEQIISQKMEYAHSFNEQPPKHPYKFLLIEDNRIALKVLESIITNAGYHFQSAVNAEMAFEYAKTMSFDLILTDLGLPGMSGQEFTRQFREWERAQNQIPIPIVGLTAHSENIIRKSCLQAGMNDAFAKPLSKSVLHTIISQFLSSKPCISHPPSERIASDSNLSHFEKKWFALDQFPLINIELALKNLNADKVLLSSMLKELLEKEIPVEKAEIEAAYKAQDWTKILNLAHKIKGGVVYLGLIKMQYACQYFERYYKTGQTKLIIPLYQQMIHVLDETGMAIQTWITSDAIIT